MEIKETKNSLQGTILFKRENDAVAVDAEQ